MSSIDMFKGREQPQWCVGCGDFGILAAVKYSFAGLGIQPHEALIVSGIGCGSKLPHYMKTNGFHSIHGRALPLATGAKLANHGMTVLVVAGDGDSYGIGGNHFLHVCRRNPDITHIVENNHVYGLTKGQYSPTSELGSVSATSPEGTSEPPVNPLAVALAAGAGFVARGFAGDVKHLQYLIMEGIRHRGYALIDVLQPCVTFDRTHSYTWYRDRVYKLDETNHDPSDLMRAYTLTLSEDGRIPTGIFYREERTPHEEGFPVLSEKELVRYPLEPTPEMIESLVAEYV